MLRPSVFLRCTFRCLVSVVRGAEHLMENTRSTVGTQNAERRRLACGTLTGSAVVKFSHMIAIRNRCFTPIDYIADLGNEGAILLVPNYCMRLML